MFGKPPSGGGAASRASHRRWQAVGAECTVVPLRERRRGIGMLLSTAATRRLLFNKSAAISEMVVVEVGVPPSKTAGVALGEVWPKKRGAPIRCRQHSQIDCHLDPVSSFAFDGAILARRQAFRPICLRQSALERHRTSGNPRRLH
jgi:hypothetical protein